MIPNESDITVFGGRGLVGSAVVSLLRYRGHFVSAPVREQLDLCDPAQVESYFRLRRPKYVFLCAAKVGGIKANAADPLGFFNRNIALQNNVINCAAEYGVKKLLFLGSSCIYPRDCPQPIKEEYLLTGPIEKTTEAYALAKICGVKLCEWYNRIRGLPFISAMPPNLYGEFDEFDPETAHVVPGLIARMHAAKIAGDPIFKVWGNPATTRELMYSGDLAHILIEVMNRYEDCEPLNVGSGKEFTMLEIATYVAGAVGYSGEILFDASQPSGTPRKIMDNSRLQSLGYGRSLTPLEDSLRKTYEWYLTHLCQGDSAPERV